MSVLDDFLGTASNTLGVKNIADYFVLKNQLQIQKGLAKSTNTINELTAANSALKTQTEYQKELQASSTEKAFNFKSLIPYAIGAAVLYLGYKFVK